MARGLPTRHFFAHRSYYLAKCGPDAVYLAQKMCGRKNLDAHVEVLVFANPSHLKQFPREIFFDDELIWHRQQLGKTGHVAFGYLFIDGENLYGLNYVSDLVQRISRKREYATQVEKQFHGWRHMLFNSILNFAVERGLRTIRSPASELVMANTDKSRSAKKALFERVYDSTVTDRFAATKADGWWVIDVKRNQDRLVSPQKCQEVAAHARTICVCHDIERGFGHAGIDDERMEIGDRIGPEALSAMLRCEKAAGIKATYNVLGSFFNEVREEIETNGHCLAFHSYDHAIRKYWRFSRQYMRFRRLFAPTKAIGMRASDSDQLFRCRLVDRRVRGFRPPQSLVTPEWDDFNLVYRNFEWCAMSSRKLGNVPVMQNHLSKIPIRLDDFPLYKSNMSFEDWENRVIEEIQNRDFVAFGLHDCYADLWLPHYAAFLDKISQLGTLKTLDTVADETILASAM